MATPRTAVKVIAMTQERRGHGISTAAFFLGQTLANQHVPVLLADLTGRHTRMKALKQSGPTPRLVIWTPPAAAMRDTPAMLAQARAEVAGKASVILLDADVATLDTILGHSPTPPFDYVIVGAEHTPEGEKSAQRTAARFEALRDRNKVGVVFTRVSSEDTKEIPQQTDEGLPVLGHYPADYRLAMADDYSAITTQVSTPHQPYLAAVMRLATLLIRLVPLMRVEVASSAS